MKQQLISRLNKGRKALNSALESIDPNTGITPEWTVKEVLAHIAGWDDVSAEALRILIAEENPQVTVPQGIDAFNREMAAAWADKKYTQAYEDFSTSREEFIKTIEALPEDMVNAKFTLPWGGIGTLELIVDILSEHELEHAEDIQKRKV